MNLSFTIIFSLQFFSKWQSRSPVLYYWAYVYTALFNTQNCLTITRRPDHLPYTFLCLLMKLNYSCKGTNPARHKESCQKKISSIVQQFQLSLFPCPIPLYLKKIMIMFFVKSFFVLIFFGTVAQHLVNNSKYVFQNYLIA